MKSVNDNNGQQQQIKSLSKTVIKSVHSLFSKNIVYKNIAAET